MAKRKILVLGIDAMDARLTKAYEDVRDIIGLNQQTRVFAD